MKKLYLLFLLLIFSCNNETLDTQEEASCDGGTFVGRVVLTTQAEVNEFGSNCYTKIDGSLRLGITSTWEDLDIVDLSPLSSLTEIYSTDEEYGFGGRLLVHLKNLPSLYGLHNITSVGSLNIAYCFELTDFSGLNSLKKIGRFPEIENWTGSQTLIIRANPKLASLDGLNNLESVAKDVMIFANPNLQNINALENLIEVKGVFTTQGTIASTSAMISTGNVELDNLCGLQNLIVNGTYGDIVISGNAFNPTIENIRDGNCSQ